MKNKLSRRDFMVKTTLALGAAAACELTGIAGAEGMMNSVAPAADSAVSKAFQEETMPHVTVKLWPGRSEETKQKLADAIVKDVVDITGCSERSVSVSIEEVDSSDWKKEVYDPEIRPKMDRLYKKPGYSM